MDSFIPLYIKIKFKIKKEKLEPISQSFRFGEEVYSIQEMLE